MKSSGYALMVFLAVALSLTSITLYSDFSITNFAFAHDGDGDGIDDDTLLPVVDEASNDPFPRSGEDFESDLTAGAVVGHASNSTGSAHAHLLWSENQERLQYEIELTGISVDTTAGTSLVEAVTKVHIHQGLAGANGIHALNIFGGPAEDDAEMEVHLDDNEIHGVWGEIDIGSLTSDSARSRQLSDMREKLCDGELYFQVHTNWNGPGAIRGQIEPASELCDFKLGNSEFSATLNSAQVVAAGGTGKSGVSATAVAHFNHTQGALYYKIDFSSNVNLNSTAGITGNELTKLHIHQGAEAASGDHLLNVFGAPCFDVSGASTVPLTRITDVCDDAQMEVNLVDNTITGVWDDSDRTAGGVTTDYSRSKKLSDHISDLCNDNTYFQAHFADGNIRGQIELDDHDLCDFDPNHSDFTVIIDESQIVGGTGSSATGTADFRFSSHYDELQYDIYLDGLDTDDVQTLATTDDDLTAIHFHNAPAGTNGPIHLLNIFGTPEFSDNDYTLQPGNGTIYGIWDDADEGTIPSENGRTKKLTTSVDSLCADEVYINVHTEGFASGEIRGQILKTPDNIMCDFDLTEHADFTATLNECKLIRASSGGTHVCDDDDDDSGHGGGGHGHGSSEDLEGDVSMWFNDDQTEIYYKIDFSGVDTSSEQTLDTTADDLKKIHLHIGNENSTGGGHAFNILAPFDDDDALINNGTRIVSGIWGNAGTDDDVSAGPTAGTNLDDYYSELCSEELYFQVHNATLLMRGQVEVNGHHNNVCDSPELISAIAVAPTKILLTFDKTVDWSSNPFSGLEFPAGNGVTIDSVHNNGTNPHGHGIATLITSTSLTGTSDGELTIGIGLEDQIENAFATSANPVTVMNALGGVPLTLTSTNTNVVLTSDSTLDELIVPDGVDATLDLTSTVTNPSVGKTKVTIPAEITTTVGDGTSDEVQVILPAGLEVIGNSAGFNGVLSLPSKSSCSATFASSQTSQSCVEIGTPGVELTLSTPVKIVLPGEGSNTPFYSSFDGTLTQITSFCPSSDSPGSISSSGPIRECFFRDTYDLVIWTTHFTSFGSFTSESASASSGGGGRGSIASLMSPNLVLYNVCNDNGNGIARILTQTHISRDDIGVTTIVDDFLNYGVEQTTIFSNTYVKNTNLQSYNYDIFDAPIPSNSSSFWINVYDLDDPTFNVVHLVNISKDSCLGFDEVFPLKDDAEFIKPFEPLEIPDSWDIQELKIEENYVDPNRLVFKLSDNYSNDFKTARDYLDFKESAPEPIVESAPEPIVESAPEPIVESAPEPIVESAPEPIVESAPEPIVESAPEPIVESAPEPIVESAPEPYQCGRGTTMVDGFCKITSEVTPYSEPITDSESIDLFEKLFKWLRIK